MASNLASQADVSIVAPPHLPHGSIEQGTTLLRQDGFALSAHAAHAVRNVDEEDHRRTVDTDAVQNALAPCHRRQSATRPPVSVHVSFADT
jgi:hypothetical protein